MSARPGAGCGPGRLGCHRYGRAVPWMRTPGPGPRSRSIGGASERGNTDVEHAIYATDAILDYPQSGKRVRGRATISAQRGGHPAERHFTVQRITGHANLWVSECVITYDGVPSYSVSIMEFADQHVVHETQYFADPFGAPPWRAALAEPMPGRTIAGT
ncbi:hypothetical protein SANTM175S_09997 [Streptomyces antimycoticus]